MAPVDVGDGAGGRRGGSADGRSSTAGSRSSSTTSKDGRSSRYQAAIDARLQQLSQMDEASRRREVQSERLRQRLESMLINEAYEEDASGMSDGMSDLLRSIAARKMAARKALR